MKFLVPVIFLILSNPSVFAADPYLVEGFSGIEWEPIQNGDDDPDQKSTDFGEVANGTSATRQYRITNLSDDDLKVSDLLLEGSDAFVPSFSEGILSPSASMTFSLQFNAELEEEVAQVNLVTSAPGDFEVFSFVVAAQGVPLKWYVDSTATGAGNGSSWGSAFPKLQDALAVAGAADEVLVAAGVYYPDEGNGQSGDDRDSSFSIPDGVVLLGGYPAGGGTRDIDTHTTILSGDLQQNDVNLDGNFIAESPDQASGANAYSVVTIEGEASLSGFTITAGRADGPTVGPSQSGAGVFGEGGGTTPLHLTVEHCRFSGCYSFGDGHDGSGTAIWLDNADLDLSHSVLSNNRTVGGVGIRGGICRIEGEVRSVTIRDCLFLANEAEVLTTFNSNGTEIKITSVRSDAVCVVADTLFAGHHDEPEINGLCHFEDLASLEIERCRWVDNQANDLVSIYDCASSSIEGSTFTGNKVEDLILLNSDVALTILNTTIAANSADGVFRRVSVGGTIGTIAIGNSIIMENLGGGVEPSITVFRSHSLVSGFPADGDGNLSPTTSIRFVDFISPNDAPTAMGDYRLGPSSELIDAGLNASNTATLDLDGEARVVDGNGDGTATIDIGAYEVAAAGMVVIEDIFHNTTTGVVTLSVRSEGNTSFTAQSSSDLSANNWQFLFNGTLNAGFNVVTIPAEDYGWPEDDAFFRIAFPAADS